MKSIFNIDSPIFRFFGKIADLVILNIAFLISAIPVFTIGAGIAAMCKVTQDIMYETTDTSIMKSYFKAFRENFKKATITWLIVLALIVGLVFNFLIIDNNSAPTWAYAMLAGAAAIIVGISTLMFQLMARYENTLKHHLSNAAILFIGRFPRVLVMIAVQAVPVALVMYSIELFMQIAIFWLAIGWALNIHVATLLLKKTFALLDKPRDDAAKDEAAKDEIPAET